MLKGDIDFLVGFIIFTGFLAVVFLFLQSGYVRTEAVLETAKDTLDVIDTAHLVRGCLEEGGEIGEEKLSTVMGEGQQGPDLKELCGLAGKPHVKITDREDGREWSFGEIKKGASHTVSFPLRRSSGDVHVGEILVIVS